MRLWPNWLRGSAQSRPRSRSRSCSVAHTADTATAQVSVSLDSQSIWATVRGNSTTLDALEFNLVRAVKQDLNEQGRNSEKIVPGWVRKDPCELCVLSGLMPLVAGGSLPKLPHSVSPEKAPGSLSERFSKLEGLGYRPYQIDAIQAALDAPLGRCILDLGMGAGKTRCAAGIAYVIGGRWLYVVHGIDLVRQASETFRATGVGVRACGWTEFGRLASDLYEGVIVDECHGLGTNQRAQAMAAFRGHWRVGLSGTPLDRTDQRNALVVGLLGPVAYRKGVGDLTEDGWLAECKLHVL